MTRNLIKPLNKNVIPIANKATKIEVKNELLSPKLINFAPVNIANTSLRENYTDREIKNTQTLFSMNGNVPHIIDAINGICTHRKEIIKNQNDDSQYYEVTIPIEDFLFLGLGNYTKEYRHDFLEEIRIQTTKDREMVTLYLDNSIMVYRPFIFSGVKFDIFDTNNKIKSKIMASVTIQIFKPLLKDIVENNHEQFFIYVPFSLSACMKNTIRKNAVDLGIKDHKAYRRLLLFLLSADLNIKDDMIKFDPIEMGYYCNTHLIRSFEKDNKLRYKEFYLFVDKGLKLFQRMGQEGHLSGIQFKRGDFLSIVNNQFKIVFSKKKELPVI
jgi:hypothetical protein